MRTLSSAALTALAAGAVPLAVLVEMDLASGQLCLNTSGLNLQLGGRTYLGTGGLGRIDAMQDTPAEIRQLSFTLSGVPSENIALALAEPVQGRAVRLLVAIFNQATGAVLDARVRWAGRLDVMSIEDGPTTATVTVTAEHAGIDLIRPYTSYYTDAEQRRLVPGDLGLQYMVDQAEVRVVWPTAEWGKK